MKKARLKYYGEKCLKKVIEKTGRKLCLENRKFALTLTRIIYTVNKIFLKCNCWSLKRDPKGRFSRRVYLNTLKSIQIQKNAFLKKINEKSIKNGQFLKKI